MKLYILMLCITCPIVATADITVAENLAGVASVTDGDTLEVHGTRIRLHGIDAPESSQRCRRENGDEWRCGQTAANLLAEMIGRRSVSCESSETDRYGRAIAVCFAGGANVNEAMVAKGYAVAYRRYSTDYVHAEDEAKREKLGIWSGAFVMPWDYRRGIRLDSSSSEMSMPGECVIKGNIGKSGNFTYHIPGDQYYEATRIDTSKGERWFCSVSDAKAAGWHRAPR
ncbi:thermonuclease family protein [Parvibaculum sp.]|uniref:thermonuclease family protein n=1 Tax=Parvibaculum sp. TaxID=2024848 RepID=UPI003296E19D